MASMFSPEFDEMADEGITKQTDSKKVGYSTHIPDKIPSFEYTIKMNRISRLSGNGLGWKAGDYEWVGLCVGEGVDLGMAYSSVHNQIRHTAYNSPQQAYS